MRRIEAKRRMKNLLMFLPNMISLCGRLLTDSRVPRVEKALFAGAIVYAVMPLDFIPDMIPFVGQIDDAYLIALALLRLLHRTERDVVRQHWRGGGDIVELAAAMADVAPLLLPRNVRRVLSAKIEVAPEAEGGMLSAAARSETVLVEVQQEKRTLESAGER